MLAVNYSTVRSKLKEYCDRVVDENEVLIVTRKGEKNVVLLGLEEYNRLSKAIRNAQYLESIDLAMEQLSSGKGQKHELIES